MPNAIDFLTVDEAASFTGYSHWTIRRWLDSGRLTRYRAGVRIVVNRAELLELVKPRKEDKNVRSR